MLGNDLIDLHDIDARPETFRTGFDERVFCVEERAAIAGDHNPLARRWAHWGAKEAAYKLARQIDPSFVFSPRRLVAVFEPETSQSVEQNERRGRLVLRGLAPESGSTTPFGLTTPSGLTTPFGLTTQPGLTTPSGLTTPKKGLQADVGSIGLSVELRSFETNERIHVVAVPAKTDWDDIDYGVCRMAEDHVDSSSAVRSLAVHEIARRMGVATERISIGRRGRIPTILLDGHLTSLPLSLSHHGGWIGYAARFRVASDHRETRITGDGDSRLTPLASRRSSSPVMRTPTQ